MVSCLSITSAVLRTLQIFLIFVAIGVYFRGIANWNNRRCITPVGYSVNAAAAIISLIVELYFVAAVFWERIYSGVADAILNFSLFIFWIIAAAMTNPTEREQNMGFCNFVGNEIGRRPGGWRAKRWSGYSGRRHGRSAWKIGLDVALAILFFMTFILALVKIFLNKRKEKRRPRAWPTGPGQNGRTSVKLRSWA